ncbi:type VII secretion-associated protein [Nocardia sp. NPDC060259]|uniref:type VII secretion-associated protein n=1 Tax=Nocardia sp. NPDC060259 TaxID=3347088 RepID=UPI00366312C9
MTDIDVVVSDSRVLARNAARHADVAPTVLPVRDGIVVGAPVGPMQPAISAFALSDSAWIGFEPQPMSTAAATDAVVDQVFADLSPSTPVGSIGVAHPSSWSAAQRTGIGRSFGRYSGSIVLESIAVRVARSRQSFAASELIVVIEIGSLDVMVTAVNRTRDQIEVTASELEPTLAAGDWNDDAVELLISIISKVLGGYRPSSVILVGPHDEPLLDRLRQFVTESWTAQPTPLVQAMPTTGLLLSPSAHNEQRSRQAPEHNADWVGTLRERAAATAPSPRLATAKIVAAAAVLVTVLTVGVVVTTRGSDADAATASTTSRMAPVTTQVPLTPSAPPTLGSGAAAPRHHVMGRVTFNIPVEWQLTAGSNTDRAALVSRGATPARITVTYNTVAEQAGYDEVLRDITARIAKAEPGRFGTPERDVVFAGRRGIGYQESPGDGSVVRWYVLLDHGIQTNVGCQYGPGGWGTVSTACEEVMKTVTISP